MENDNRPAERLLRVDEAAAFLGYAVGTVYNKVQAGELPHVRIGRTLRFRRADLEALIEAGATKPAA